MEIKMLKCIRKLFNKTFSESQKTSQDCYDRFYDAISIGNETDVLSGLMAGIRIEEHDHYAVRLAAHRSRINVLELFNRVIPDFKNHSASGLGLALDFSRKEAASFLIGIGGADSSHVYIAIRRGMTECIKQLLEQGFEIDYVSEKELSELIEKGYNDTVNLVKKKMKKPTNTLIDKCRLIYQ